MDRVLKKVQRHLDTLTAAERKIAAWMESSTNAVAFRTLSELAGEIGVSEATIIRFARKIGYSSYPTLQRDVQDALQEKFSLEARFTRSMNDGNGDGTLDKWYRTQLQNLRETFEGLDPDAVERFVEHIVRARRVAVVGFRASSGVATYLAFALNMVRPDVTQVQLALDNVHDQVLDYSEDDVLIAFSLSRPARKTLQVVDEAKDAGLTILGITNSRFSPLAEWADPMLIAATHGTFNNYSAIMALCHLVLEATARQLRDSAEVRLRALDERNSKDVFYRP